MRIGILGGTFNPVHSGHLHMAKVALRKLRLRAVIFVPTFIPPHKRVRANISAEDRVRMLQLALEGNKRFTISLYEIRRKGISYSINTIKYFKKKYGSNAELFFLIGADSLMGLKTWKSIKRLLELAQFVVIPRPGFNAKKAPSNIIEIRTLGKDISSAAVRKLIKKGRSIKRFVPKKVFRYIKRRGLYT